MPQHLTGQAISAMMAGVIEDLGAEPADGAALITALRATDETAAYQNQRLKDLLEAYKQQIGAKGGHVTATAITSGGTGYSVGDMLKVEGSAGGEGGVVEVTSVSSGVIDGVAVKAKGGNYSGTISVSTTGVGNADAVITATVSYEEEAVIDAAIAAL